MSYPEVHQTAKEKLESTQSKMSNCLTDLAFVPDNELVELLWENGQIVMQGQSSRTEKHSLSSFSSDVSKVQEKDGRDDVFPKIGRYGNIESVMNNFSSPGPSEHVGLVQDDDDMVPWLNYPIGDSLQNDYCSEFFPELTGANLNALSVQNNAVLIGRSGSHGQVRKDSHVVSGQGSGNQEHRNPSEVVGGSEPDRIRISQSFSAEQFQNLASNLSPRVSDFLTNNNNAHHAMLRNLTQSPVSATGIPNAEMHKKDQASTRPPESSTSTGLMNFSHFSRPAALVKANLQGISAVSAGLSSADRLKSNDKVSVNGSNLTERSLVESTSCSKSVVGVRNEPVLVPAMADSKSYRKPPQELISVEKSEATCQEDASRNNNNSPDNVHQSSSSVSVALRRSESEKALDPVVASSSVCSGNSTGGFSSETKHGMKRKARDLEESEYQSEDVENESTYVKKPTKCFKRNRTAEVHNLSERRRRDRINEKMRALQELIPNCNKVDKASMLDEAIEYLKTLQLQVQIMSMGSRLCMPPMMLPAGIQHIRTPHMPHFSPMGVGMGMVMGTGFGMGIPDMNFSTNCPMVPVPSIHGAQLPCPSVPGAANLHGMQASGLQMFGVSGQILPFAHSYAPFLPLSGGFCPKELPVPNVSVAASPVSVPDLALLSSSKDQTQHINLQTMHKMSTDCSQIQTLVQETKECSELGDFVQTNNTASSVSSSGAISTLSRNGVAPSGTTSQ